MQISKQEYSNSILALPNPFSVLNTESNLSVVN